MLAPQDLKKGDLIRLHNPVSGDTIIGRFEDLSDPEEDRPHGDWSNLDIWIEPLIGRDKDGKKFPHGLAGCAHFHTELFAEGCDYLRGGGREDEQTPEERGVWMLEKIQEPSLDEQYDWAFRGCK